jgi:hypothetical protein
VIDEFAELMDEMEKLPNLPERAADILKRMVYLYYVEGNSSEYLSILDEKSILESRLSSALRDLRELESGKDIAKLQESYKAAYEGRARDALRERDAALAEVEELRKKLDEKATS